MHQKLITIPPHLGGHSDNQKSRHQTAGRLVLRVVINPATGAETCERFSEREKIWKKITKKTAETLADVFGLETYAWFVEKAKILKAE